MKVLICGVRPTDASRSAGAAACAAAAVRKRFDVCYTRCAGREQARWTPPGTRFSHRAAMLLVGKTSRLVSDLHYRKRCPGWVGEYRCRMDMEPDRNLQFVVRDTQSQKGRDAA